MSATTFAAIATPRADASLAAQSQTQTHLTHDARAAATVSTKRTRNAALALRSAIVLTMAAFVFGNVATWAPLYEIHLINTMSRWWKGYPRQHHSAAHTGVAHNIIDTGVGRNITITGHTEMIRPTFLLIFCILPFLASLLLIELLQHMAPARRVTSVAVWRFAMWMRRKPRFPLLGVSRLCVGEWLFGVVFVIGGNALCFFYQWDRRIANANAAVKAGTGKLDTTKYFNIVGISSAYLCIYNMAFLLLPVTRTSPWMTFFNISYANGVKLHRWVGYATVVTGVMHTGGYWGKWIRDGTFVKNQTPCIHCDLGDDATGYYAWFNFFGLLSVLALLLMIPTSLPLVRRKVYEWFYLTHWVLFVVAVFFAILHWAQILWWILPAGLVFFVSRAVSSWNGMAPVIVERLDVVGGSGSGNGSRGRSDSNSNSNSVIRSADDSDDELVRVVLQRAAPGASPAASAHDYKVGNFVYLNAPHIARLEWHALTIASSPQTSATELTLLVKPLGDWSCKLVQYAKDCRRDGVSPLLFLDGYYGASLEMYDEYPTLCLVGGGIGVTPLLAVLEDVAARVAANGGKWTQRVVFILSVRELALLHVLAPVLTRLRELDPLETHFTTRLYATRAPSDAALDTALTELDGSQSTVDGAPAAMTATMAATLGKDPRGVAPAVHGERPTAASRTLAPRAFYEPLRSSTTLRMGLIVALFIATIFAVAAARWGNGAIQGDNHPQLWPLERAFELTVFCASIVLVYAAIWFEWVSFRRSSAHSNAYRSGNDDERQIVQPVGGAAQTAMAAILPSDVHSMRDLLRHLHVVVGERPDMHALLLESLAIHDGASKSASASPSAVLPVVGVLVSGPTSLKMATNEAVVALGRAKFDVHEEEFEL